MRRESGRRPAYVDSLYLKLYSTDGLRAYPYMYVLVLKHTKFTVTGNAVVDWVFS
jgi:hypothetical protein